MYSTECDLRKLFIEPNAQWCLQHLTNTTTGWNKISHTHRLSLSTVKQ